MATVTEMAEVHLVNVEREINGLQEKKVAIDQEIERLTLYLAEGKEALTPEVPAVN